MNYSAVVLLGLAMAGILWTAGCTPENAGGTRPEDSRSDLTGGDQSAATAAVAPYLAELEQTLLYGDIWERPGLSKRDRSMITMAATQALYEPEEFGVSLRRALDEGLTQEEISEIVTQVALYAGWPTGSSASRVANEVYRERGLSYPDAGEGVTLEIGLNGQRPGYPAFPYLSALTRSLLYGEPDGVWSRPGLSPRDRSMVTVAVQQALYETQQLRGHIGRALDNGVTQRELEELITHVTFYAGWPTGSNAARVAAEVFAERGLPLDEGP